ncbi:MAG TPA: aminotransferase class I/II-fold pyridoxal phosphate-dependent enzyme, partial [Chitinophagaceae bacterium]
NAGASMVSLAAANASLKDREFVRTSRENNRQANDFTFNGLKSIGFECIPSSTNFLYYSAKKYNGNWSEIMRSKNFIIGRSSNDDGKWTRTTIGTMEEMQAFITAARQLV